MPVMAPVYAARDIIPEKGSGIRFGLVWLVVVGLLLSGGVATFAVTHVGLPFATASEQSEEPTAGIAGRYVAPLDEIDVYATINDATPCIDQADMDVADYIDELPAPKPGVRGTIDHVADTVGLIRGAAGTKRTPVRFVSRHQLGQRMARAIENGFSAKQERLHSKLLVKLGLLGPQQDLGKLAQDHADGAVLGYYDPRSGKIVSTGIGSELAPMDELTLAHELTHALADDENGLPKLTSKDPMKSDELLARRAIVEGDATLAQTLYLMTAMSPEEQSGTVQSSARVAAEASEGIPFVLRRSAEFPYLEGLAFVCHRYAQGYWPAVNALYQNPPVSTAQIIYPERYEKGIVPVAAPEVHAPAGWKERVDTALGVADLLLMFDSETSHPVMGQSVDRARGWNGGALRAYENGKRFALQMTLVDGGVETELGVAYQLCDQIASWHLSKFGEPLSPGADPDVSLAQVGKDVSALSCADGIVRFATAPGERVALALVEAG